MSTDGLGDSFVSNRTWWCATHRYVTKAEVSLNKCIIRESGKEGEGIQRRSCSGQTRWKTRGGHSTGGQGSGG